MAGEQGQQQRQRNEGTGSQSETGDSESSGDIKVPFCIRLYKVMASRCS